MDESQTDVFVLTEPETQMHDGQQCIITISAEPVTANYSEKDLKKQVTQRLKEIGSVNFTVWNPSLTATRTLLDSKGVYANYTGTLANGVELAGRILYASTNNKLYGVGDGLSPGLPGRLPEYFRQDPRDHLCSIRQAGLKPCTPDCAA